jgi:hypothetical protein
LNDCYHVRIKNKERLIKVVERKIICNQEEICIQEEICSQERICSEEICDEEIICSQEFFSDYKNARKIIQKRSFDQHKEINLCSSNALFFFFVKDEFSSIENQHF